MKVPERPIRVLFLLQRPEAWGNVASIWQAMANNPAFQPTAWLLPYNARDSEISARYLPPHRRLLVSQGVRWVEWAPGMQLAAGQFDVAVFTHPYDRERPRALWFDRVRACVRKIMYVPYGLSVGAGTKNLHLQFAQPLQTGADLVVARSPTEKAMYARYCPAGDAKVQVLGHPRFDRLLKELKTVDASLLKARIGGRPAILWNSHFSFGHQFSQSSNFSSFDLLGPELLDYFVAHRATLCLLWRPHPGLFSEILKQGILTEQQLPMLRAELDDLDIVLDEQVDHLPAFACSHALISDPGSFLFEYLATGKPLLPLINQEGEPLNTEAATLVAACGSASKFSEVECFISKISDCSIDHKFYKTLREQYLPLLDGKAGDRVCAALLGQKVFTMDADISNYLLSKIADCPIALEQDLMSFAEIPIPPVLAQLQAGLRQIRAQKIAQTRLHKWSRRQLNRVRINMGEMMKKIPWMMNVLSYIRN